jgi:hypothetical protein
MPQETKSQTQISFDLSDVLKPEEVERFTKEAERAGVSPTEHFINLTLKGKDAA